MSNLFSIRKGDTFKGEIVTEVKFQDDAVIFSTEPKKEEQQPKDKDVFDSEKIKRVISDEAGQVQLVFKMNGCKFRWDAFKMSYEVSHPKSLERVINNANEIINWVNENNQTFNTLNTNT